MSALGWIAGDDENVIEKAVDMCRYMECDRDVQFHIKRLHNVELTLKHIAHLRERDVPQGREYLRKFAPDPRRGHDEIQGNQMISDIEVATDALGAAIARYRGGAAA